MGLPRSSGSRLTTWEERLYGLWTSMISMEPTAPMGPTLWSTSCAPPSASLLSPPPQWPPPPQPPRQPPASALGGQTACTPTPLTTAHTSSASEDTPTCTNASLDSSIRMLASAATGPEMALNLPLTVLAQRIYPFISLTFWWSIDVFLILQNVVCRGQGWIRTGKPPCHLVRSAPILAQTIP